MFPWAHGGNLVDYWRKKYDGKTEQGELLWLVDQFTGLSSALGDLHRHWNSHQGQDRNCIHGDLKPENILLFEESDGRLLKIADMGLAAFHAEPHTNIRDPSGMPMGTSRYTPPEMRDQNEEKKSRGRAYDLWSMGCVILELLVWLTSGYEALDGFKSHTPHFWSDQNGKGTGLPISMHPYVNAYMKTLSQKLQHQHRHDSLLMGLLDIVRKLLTNKEDRLNAEDLTSDLKKVRKLCTPGTAYQEPFRITYSEDEIQRNREHQPPLVYTYPGSSLQVPTHTPKSGGTTLPIDDSSSTPRDTPPSLPDGTNGASPSDGDHRNSIPKIQVEGVVSDSEGEVHVGPDASQEVSWKA